MKYIFRLNISLIFFCVNANAGENLLEKTLDLCKVSSSSSSSLSQNDIYEKQKACVRGIMKCVNKKISACGSGCFVPAGANHQAIVRSCAEQLGE